MLLSFVFFLGVFTLIGLAAAKVSQGTKADYYLASRQIKPWLVGLSAVATNNSGYMFIGVIGYTYSVGFVAFWLMAGWIVGDLLASLYVHQRLCSATSVSKQYTYAGVLSAWSGQQFKNLRRLIAVIAFIFLVIYAGAQLVAGSKALFALFDWPLWSGAVMGALLIVAYCLSGGIRASIWTDAAQSAVMLVAMAVLLFTATNAVGGADMALQKMRALPGFTEWVPQNHGEWPLLAVMVFILGWMFAGFSVIGQPHIMIRFMALDDVKKMRQARWWYYIWFIAFYTAATLVGLLSRLLLPESDTFDAELALPTIAEMLLDPWLVGLIVAAIFAATMSTADSLLLTCSSALTSDLPRQPVTSTRTIRVATMAVTALALGLALSNNESVFQIVIFSWSGLASAFAPLLLARCLGWNLTERVAIVAVILGLATAIIWRLLGWHVLIYEGMPGIMVGLGLLWVFSLTKSQLAPIPEAVSKP
ncbi:sodium/proline symporter [Oceanicoccus sp. KOV_DT_Chl]|uniref:sodium/proline symporter n=1 Tax=Oceanicoccus sp. KOV_DT_Chl TaxID=1904639 RepID=UPI00190ED6C6|nr:sodium/proline symporter [Oceanicoccus sp. KOV_DT_Chl]